MPPPPWPRSEADLDAWHIYADWLIEAGDVRGPILAHELSLSRDPPAAAVDEYRRRAQRLKRIHRALRAEVELGWSLGHVRELGVRAGVTLERLRPSLADPSMQLVEEIQLYEPILDGALVRALPSSCTRLMVAGNRLRDGVGLLDSLPPSVTVLAVTDGSPEYLVSDRLTELDVRVAIDDRDRLTRLIDAVEATRTVRVRLSRLPAQAPRHERVVIGHAGEAALIATASGRLITLPRPSLRTLQGEVGLVPIRALLARALPERYRLSSLDGQRVFGFGPPNVSLTRAADGRWSASGRDTFGLRGLSLNGAPVRGERTVALSDGDRLAVNGVEWTFVDDVARLGTARE